MMTQNALLLLVVFSAGLLIGKYLPHGPDELELEKGSLIPSTEKALGETINRVSADPASSSPRHHTYGLPLHRMPSNSVYEPVKYSEDFECDPNRRYTHAEIYLELQVDSESCSFTSLAEGDGAKNLCGSAITQNDIVLSLGSRNDWSFEEIIGAYTKNVHTFDCTVVPNQLKPPFVKFYHQCLGNKFHYSFQDLARDVGFTAANRVILKMDIETSEWDLIEEIVESPLAPETMMIEIHFHFQSRCNNLRKARYWWKTVNKRYQLQNWRYNHLCGNCIETTYTRRPNTPALKIEPCLECRTQFRVFNGNLSSTVMQLVSYMMQTTLSGQPYCLQNSLLNPNVFAMEDYSWLSTLLDIVPCSTCTSSCDRQLTWWPSPKFPTPHPPFNSSVVEHFRDSKQSAEFYTAVSRSVLNQHYDNCLLLDPVHSTTLMDPESIATDWMHTDTHVFVLKSDLAARITSTSNCKASSCTLEPVHTQRTFINLITCRHVNLPSTEFGLMIQALRSN